MPTLYYIPLTDADHLSMDDDGYLTLGDYGPASTPLVDGRWAAVVGSDRSAGVSVGASMQAAARPVDMAAAAPRGPSVQIAYAGNPGSAHSVGQTG